MRLVLFLALCLVAVSLVSALSVTKKDFDTFVLQYNRTYHSKQEYLKRFKIFSQNVLDAHKRNEEANEQLFGVTKFSDLSPAEFKRYYLNSAEFSTPKSYSMCSLPSLNPAPSVDWRNAGVVTPVYNQGQCGSCWAFSATEALESSYAYIHKTQVQLSMQQVVSCDTGSYGCGGGWPAQAFDYIQEVGGIQSYSSYPYIDYNGGTYSCRFNPSAIFTNVASSCFVSLSTRYGGYGPNENGMMLYINQYPAFSVCVYAMSWQSYTGPAALNAQTCCPTGGCQIDHCVQVVGYGSLSGQTVWWIRNSWGTDWSPSYAGYIPLVYGQDTCFVAEAASAVTST